MDEKKEKTEEEVFNELLGVYSDIEKLSKKIEDGKEKLKGMENLSASGFHSQPIDDLKFLINIEEKLLQQKIEDKNKLVKYFPDIEEKYPNLKKYDSEQLRVDYHLRDSNFEAFKKQHLTVPENVTNKFKTKVDKVKETTVDVITDQQNAIISAYKKKYFDSESNTYKKGYKEPEVVEDKSGRKTISMTFPSEKDAIQFEREQAKSGRLYLMV